MKWNDIRLELAPTPEFPSGSVGRGYLIRVPLKDDGTIDEPALAEKPGRAIVRRFWSSEPEERGHIVRFDGQWTLNCNGRLAGLISVASRLRTGEEIAVADPAGDTLPFRVARVRRLD